MTYRHLAQILLLAGGLCLLGQFNAHGESDNPSGLHLLDTMLPIAQLPDAPQNLHEETQVREALQRCEEILRESPDAHEVLLQAAYLSYRLGWLFADRNERKKLYFKLFDYAARARQVAPTEYRTALLLAVAKAKTAEYLSRLDQVRIARELAQEATELVQQQANDSDAIHLLSWLNFKVGSVSPLQKVLAAALFGGLPKGLSVENAFIQLQRARQLRPEYVVYQYDLGIYHLRTGEKEKARRQFDQVLARPTHTAEERVYQRRARSRLDEMAAQGQ